MDGLRGYWHFVTFEFITINQWFNKFNKGSFLKAFEKIWPRMTCGNWHKLKKVKPLLSNSKTLGTNHLKSMRINRHLFRIQFNIIFIFVDFIGKKCIQ